MLRVQMLDEERDHVTVLDWALLDWALSFSGRLSQKAARHENVSVSKLVQLGMLTSSGNGQYRLTARAVHALGAGQ